MDEPPHAARGEPAEAVAQDMLSIEEIGRRASGGAALLVARGGLMLALGLVANVILARLLEPRDFGIVALGTVLITVGAFLADGGLGSGLIRRAEAPRRRELEAVNGIQLIGTLALAAGAAAVAAIVGGDAPVVALMVANLPIMILKVPSSILLERSLNYRPIATVDVVEAVVYYVWAVTAVALGAGVWGVATAVTARALAGVATMARLGPVGLIRGRWSWADVRPLLRFGGKYQANVVVVMARDQGLNIAIAAIAGVATLGVWSLAWRFLQIATMLFDSLGRVAYPLMSRLLGAGQDPRPVVERGSAALAVVCGAVMVALTAFAPALPVLVGDGWEQVPSVLLWAGMAMIALSPVIVGSSGYLFAADAGGAVAVGALAGAVVWYAVALPLLPELGAPAAGIGWCAGALVNLAIVGRRSAAESGAALAAKLGPPLALAIAAAAGGWLLARELGGSVPAGLVAVAAGEAFLFAALALLRRSALRDTRGLVGQAVRNLAGARGETDAAVASRG